MARQATNSTQFWLSCFACLPLLVLASAFVDAQPATIDTILGGNPDPGEILSAVDVGIDPRAVVPGGPATAADAYILTETFVWELVGSAMRRLAGNGTPGFQGDGGAAMDASFLDPRDIAVSEDGLSLYVADAGNFRIRRIDLQSGTITTFAGDGSQGSAGDGGPATQASLGPISAIDVDLEGDLWIATATRVRTISNQTNVITTVTDGSATDATIVFGWIVDIAVDPAKNLYMIDDINRAVYFQPFGGSALQLAFEDDPASGGDGSGPLVAPRAIAIDDATNLYLADQRCTLPDPKLLRC